MRTVILAGALMASMSFVGSVRADVRPELRTQIADEERRLVQHFYQVLGELEARDTSHLTESQQRKRSLVIALLRRYRARGIFPKNRDFNTNTPYFIDASGTRCAMAYLIEESGDRELVARVNRTANNAYVKELASDPQLVQWLRLNGVSLQEAARIQPTYDPPSCVEQCRDDEQCTYGESGNECSKFCEPNADSCGTTSTCEGQLNGLFVCVPAVRAEGARPEPESCSVAGKSSAAAWWLLGAMFVAFRRRRLR